MAWCSTVCARLATRVAATIAAVVLSATVGAAIEQGTASPRLREARLPTQMPEAFGGGEVVLELTVDPRGTVTRVDRVRVTLPYADLVASSAVEWHFEPATVVIDGRPTAIAAPVLVVGVFRPPSFYAGPSPGVPAQTLHAPSARLPRLQSVAMPAYPPTATGNGIVLVEIEMTGRAQPRTYRIVGPPSGFDTAALDAVRAWRFEAPQFADASDRLFVYAVVGFRAPLAPDTRPRQ
jgi:outer membrane biosynthesis protein TonB